MSVTENLIAGIIIFLVFMAVGVVYVAKTTEKRVAVDQFQNTYLLDKKTSYAFDTALSLIEPFTGRQLGDLIASATYYKRDTIHVAGTTLNISAELDNSLNTILSGREYYFEAFPRIDSMKLVFFITSDARMLDVFEVLERDFDNLVVDLNSVYRDLEVDAEVVILEGESLCLDALLDCTFFTEFDIYNNNISSEIEMKKWRYGLLRPELIVPGVYSYANDWETALSYYMIKSTNNNLTNIEILFPIIDSLPAASDGNTCPQSYAHSILERDSEIFSDFGFIVNPIIVDNPDYCPADVVSHVEQLIAPTKGTLHSYNQNFITDIHRVIEKNLGDIRISGGIKKAGAKYVIQRDLQLPNGELTKMRLHVYI